MPPSGIVNASVCDKKDSNLSQKITDVYISIFFDGTGNNMYEQVNKAERLRKKFVSRAPLFLFSIPNLFDVELYDEMHDEDSKNDNAKFEEEYGESYRLQKEQAEYDFHIESPNKGRGRKNSVNDNSGWKYSNVAVMRSLTKKHSDCTSSDDGIIGISYNLYIEGSGKNWDEGSDMVALGMGVRKQGVVGLVSKAVVFVQHFIDSNVDVSRKQEVKVHFAVFGFSRGSTCGRLFSFLAVNNYVVYNKKKYIINELTEYLPQSFIRDRSVKFLEDYNKKNITVDFLGLYDTVSSIGFLQKFDNTTNYGINNYVPYETEHNNKDGKRVVYVNKLHGTDTEYNDIMNNVTVAKYIGKVANQLIPYPIDEISEGVDIVLDNAESLVAPVVIKGQEKRDRFFGDAKYNFHRDNVKNYGLDPYTNINVKHTFQISAIDEYRENFALVDLGAKLSECHCTEIMMPGCHSDIGGGYMYNDDINKYTLRRRISEMDTLISSAVDPRNVNHDYFNPISLSSMKDLGWLTRDEHDADKKKKRFKIESNGKQIKKVDDATEDTPGQTTFILEDENKVEFERFVKEGYSNIALKLMINRTIGSHGLNSSSSKWPKRFLPFQEILPRRFDCDKVNQDHILDDMKRKCTSAETVKEGNRYWILCNPDNYKDLRREYLHFTCTDELNAEQGILDYSTWGANVGNPPNWRKMSNYGYLLCRLVYRGNAEDNNLHYMSEYGKDGNL